MFGFLNINKPVEMTSREAVDKVKRVVWHLGGAATKKIKLGHAGTLDPLASGVLVIALGPATRLIPYVQKSSKTYLACFQLGVTSATLDLESERIAMPTADQPTRQQLEQVLERFVGSIVQVPPAYSAAKIGGRRAYRLARKGREVELQPRSIQIDSIQLRRFEYPEFELEIRCGTGTYIRALGRDIGESLNSAAVMTRLCRTSIGPFDLQTAIDPDTIDEAKVVDSLIDPRIAVSDLRQIELSPDQCGDLKNGTKIELPDVSEQELAAVDQENRLIALLRVSDDDRFRPFINFAGHYESQITETSESKS